MTHPPFPTAPVPASRVRAGIWFTDLVVGWILVGLLTIASLLLDLGALLAGSFLLLCADDESGRSCRAVGEAAGHAVGTLALAWLPVVAAYVVLGALASRRVPVFWVPLAAAAVAIVILIVGANTMPGAA